MKQARFIAPARREFLRQVAYYEKEEPGLGVRFTKAVEDATARAVSLPLAGSPAAKGTRRMMLSGFPFSVVYRPDAQGITVFAVAHHARRPNYWEARRGL